ncbi:TPA: replication protein [Serratia liquefaciens]|nr:replication protein [Serratia liquefaciens]
MNAVRHLTLVRTSPEVVEQRVAQLEDGYTRLANELLDAVMAAGLSETEMCVVLAVWRKTYGYSKKMDWISNEQLEQMIGKHLTHCSTAKNVLINKKVLAQEGRKVGMNTNVSEWKTKNNGFCKTLAKPAKKTLAEVANGPLQKVLTTKDNIQKIKENTQTHDVGLPLEEKLTPRQKGTNPRAKGTNPRSAMQSFDRERLKETWNCKAEKYGLPKIRNVSTTVENGLKRLWQSYLKQCKELGNQPNEIDTFLNGYLAHGYTPTKWACGDNPEGKRYGIETALRQEKIDEILSRED